MLDKVIDTIEKYGMLAKGDSVVIGLSGGADSVCLAHLLLRLKEKYLLKLCAVHVNHGIRGESAENDENFVVEFCKKNALPLEVIRADIPKMAREKALTLEEAGRQRRYLAFEAAGTDKIAVAHNLNDNAETMLMRLCRGTGLKGMGGILPVRGNIIRPLIMCQRSEIEAYCHENGLDYCTDETNLTTDYTRNKIRHKILPLLEEINPDTVTGLGRNAMLFRQENDYIENTAMREYEKCANGSSLYLPLLEKLEKPILYRVLRLACENAVGLKDISLEHIEIIEGLFDKPSGKRADLPKGLVVMREYDSLVFAAKNEEVDILLELDKAVSFRGKNYMISKHHGAGGIGIRCETPKPLWCLRTRRNGDIFMRGDGREIKLKKHFIDTKVPLSQRDGRLLLAEGERVYNVEGQKNKFGDANYYFYIRGEENE